MFSKELLKGIAKEFKKMPGHARNVTRSYKEVLAHEKYAYGAHRRQYVCYFEPDAVDRTKPIVVFYHGGSWMVGKPELFTDRARVFVEQGYVVIMPTHRRLPFNRYYEIREDMISVLALTKKILVEKGMPDSKIVLAGMSSGGNLAALSFLDTSIALEADFPAAQILAGFFCAAPLHLGGMPDSVVIRGYADEPHTNMFRLASPISHLSADFPTKPVLIVHGSEDGLVAFSSILSFKQRLQEETSIDLTFCTLPNGSHIDAVHWAVADGEVRQIILEWMAGLRVGA